MNGREITFLERQRVELNLAGKWSIRRIAKTLYRNHGVISREIQRNSKPSGKYSAVYAEEQTKKRRVCRGNVRRKLDKDERLRDYVLSELKCGRNYCNPKGCA
ncbi:MAG: helix-turn-helix domain-containing protein [Candidatus Uhrbacteria bacterium]|nr:helix-turn-helix domain-containing protein [Candidatus Uhrbacteria bacterium]